MLKRGVFGSLTGVNGLYLHDNSLVHLEAGIFWEMTNLTLLNIMRNNLQVSGVFNYKALNKLCMRKMAEEIR